MTAAVLTWKQPVVRQRDADLANLRSRLDVHIGINDEAMRRIENQSDAQHVDTRHRLRAVETAFAKYENELTRNTSRLELDFGAKLDDFRAQVADVRHKLMLREGESRRAKAERRPSTPTIEEEDAEEMSSDRRLLSLWIACRRVDACSLAMDRVSSDRRLLSLTDRVGSTLSSKFSSSMMVWGVSCFKIQNWLLIDVNGWSSMKRLTPLGRISSV